MLSKGECFQVNSGVKAVFNESSSELESLSIKGKSVDEKSIYSICLQGYHFDNSQANLNISHDEMLALGKSKVVSTSAHDVLLEYLRDNQNTTRKIEGRLVYRK